MVACVHLVGTVTSKVLSAHTFKISSHMPAGMVTFPLIIAL